MKKILMAVVALACAVAVISCNGKKTNVTEGNKSEMDTLSYALGADYGLMFHHQMGDIPFNVEKFQAGFLDGAYDEASVTREDAVNKVREFLSNVVPARRQQNAAIAADSTSTETPLPMFENDEECADISYAFGIDIGCGLRESKLPIKTYWFNEGLANGFAADTKMQHGQIQEFLQYFFMEKWPMMLQEAAAEWLAEQESKSGVKKTESGLLYKVVEAGDMSLAATDDRDEVTVHYTGRNTDGDVFDSSYFKNLPEDRQKMMREYMPDRFDEEGNIINDEPATFPLNRVIKGWTEGMKLVGPGGKIILYIPSELAYGARSQGRLIGPHAALEFEVELISVQPFAAKEAEAGVEAE